MPDRRSSRDALLEVRDLRCGYAGNEVVHGVDLDVRAGEYVCIVGANGCGKTTTLKCVLGLLPRAAGDVRVEGEDVLALDERSRARRFAYIPQAHTPPFPFSVADVVLLGRTPHLPGGIARATGHDREVAYAAMQALSLEALAHEEYTRLSGGQRQLVLIARALAQQPDVLVMDEPTASLDFGNQQLVLSRMRGLADGGMGVLMVTHDPNHAFYCADRVAVMDKGRVVGEGPPDEVVTTAMLREVYGADAVVKRVFVDEVGDERNAVIPL